MIRILLLLFAAISCFTAETTPLGLGPAPASSTIYSGGAAPANTQIVYSNGTTLTGSANLTTDGTSLTIGGNILQSGVNRIRNTTAPLLLQSDGSSVQIYTNSTIAAAFDVNQGLTVYGSTLTGASSPVLSLTQTWNNAATTFTGALINITNTASAAGSKILDLQIGGMSYLGVGPYVVSSLRPYIRSDGANLIINSGSSSQLYLNLDTNAAISTGTGTFAFNGHRTYADATDTVLGTTTGTKIGTATNQKLGFWGATPIPQKIGYGTPTGALQTASFPGATATLAQTSAELAQLLLDLKASGVIGN